VQTKYRFGAVDRVERGGRAIIRGMFKRETKLDLFIGRVVLAACGARGTVQGPFGQSGKVRVEFDGLSIGLVTKDERVALVVQKGVFG
jgi:selenocysteine-specific elongation factor